MFTNVEIGIFGGPKANPVDWLGFTQGQSQGMASISASVVSRIFTSFLQCFC